ncbi:MAG: PAS domain S-box protein [Caldilineaceae bacterium]
MTYQLNHFTTVETAVSHSPIDLAQIIELSPVALILIGSDGYIQIWNRGAAAVFGYEAHEVVGRSVYDVFSNMGEIAATAGQQLLADSVLVRQELQMQHKTGRTIQVGYSAALVRDADGAVTGTIVACSDVTQRYRSTEILRALEDASKHVLSMRSWDDIFHTITERLRRLGLHFVVMLADDAQQQLNVYYVLGGIEGDAENYSDLAVEVKRRLVSSAYTFSESQLSNQIRQDGKPIFIPDILPHIPLSIPEDTRTLVGEFLDEPRNRKAIAAALRRDDKINGLLLTVGALSEADMPAISAFTNHLSLALANAELWQELEARVVQRTAQLSAQQEQLQTILNNIDDAVILTDAEERIEFVNPAWEQLNGYTLAEVIGRTPRLLASPETSLNKLVDLRHHIHHGKAWTGELVNLRKDKTLYDMWIHIAPVFEHTGQIRHFVGIGRDITEEKSVARAKEKFVQDMSHELRTPLTNIKFYLSLLEKQSPNLESRYMDTLKRETDRLHLLMENLLLLLRLDQGYMNLRLKVEDLKQTVEAILEDYSSRPTSQHILLSRTLPETPAWVCVDNLLLSRALGNIANNAFNYANSQITLRICQKNENDVMWTGVSLTDDGPGISPEEQAQIFKRFFRGAASQNQQSSSAGIGLSIAHEIATLLGGKIECTSQTGQGSTFIFWLPTAST